MTGLVKWPGANMVGPANGPGPFRIPLGPRISSGLKALVDRLGPKRSQLGSKWDQQLPKKATLAIATFLTPEVVGK